MVSAGINQQLKVQAGCLEVEIVSIPINNISA